ncbi:MAG: hypothetical protein Q8880_05645 [Bacteroidota bacterium]|nr:hypothetical protein [Bacteroidota bacterium]
MVTTKCFKAADEQNISFSMMLFIYQKYITLLCSLLIIVVNSFAININCATHLDSIGIQKPFHILFRKSGNVEIGVYDLMGRRST